MVEAMLQDATDEPLRRLDRERIVAPRRARLRHIPDRAAAVGLIDADADLDFAVTAATSTPDALRLAGAGTTSSWPRRATDLVWKSGGGSVPTS